MMKKILFFTVLLIGLACSKDDDHQNTLPPETQEGAGTFACYVDGEPFIDDSGGWFNCFYQYVDGGYHFGIGGDRGDDKLQPQYLYILSEKKQLFENETYQLKKIKEGNVYAGGGFYFSITNEEIKYTDSDYTGELTITKLDFEEHIVSGTFWFNIEHPETGDTVKIREGRFDTYFTM